jgi:predicted dehydrogenase
VPVTKRIATVAQIGCGYWGPNLLRNIVLNKRCTLKRVVDFSTERREFVRTLYPSVIVSDNNEDIFEDPDIDAVVIATPASSHFELSMMAMRAGKHILVEKPMARTVNEIEEIERLSKAKKLVAMAGHTFLYNAAVRHLKEFIDSGELGEIRYIYSQRLNLGRIRSDTDALWNFAPHDVSIIQYLLGDPVPLSVTRLGMDYIQQGIDDVVFLNINYPSKIMANIHVSWLDPHKVRRMTVVGSKKMVLYDDVAENKIAIYDKGIEPRARLGESMDFDAPSPTFDVRSGEIVMPKIHYEEPLKVEINHFLDCILNGKPCLTDTIHAMNVIRILNSADYR